MRRSNFEILDALLSPAVIVAAFLVLSYSASAVAQTSRGSNPSDPVSADKGLLNGEDNRSVGSIEEEMRAKRAIKYAEKEHQENVDRAHEISSLGLQLQEDFKRKKTIDREGAKKLERLEKLTKKLRSEAGGAEVDFKMQGPPTDLADAVGKLAQVANSLADKVEKTPRQVVSAGVIDDANVLLELIGIVRTLTVPLTSH